MEINSNNLTQVYESKNTVQEQNFQQKKYEELNLMDSFLFESVTEKQRMQWQLQELLLSVQPILSVIN